MAGGNATKAAAAYLDWYRSNFSAAEAAAQVLEQHIASILDNSNIRSMMISARAKSIDSVRGKLLRKPYKRPSSQLTDRLGIRVIVYHAHEVDRVAQLLRDHLTIKERHSSDKREALGLREFGYRSYHLVASIPGKVATNPSLWSLRGQTFEVQIRSLLEHIWAEIEHDVIYKSGADWPALVKRRFASVAGVLELLEHEFSELLVAASSLVREARTALNAHFDKKRNLDVPTMCAILEMERPNGLSFSAARESGTPFPAGMEQRFQLALNRLNVRTAGSLLRLLRSHKFRASLRRYSDSEGVVREEVSHLATLALCVGVRNRQLLSVFFPEFNADPSVSVAINQSASQR